MMKRIDLGDRLIYLGIMVITITYLALWFLQNRIYLGGDASEVFKPAQVAYLKFNFQTIEQFFSKIFFDRAAKPVSLYLFVTPFLFLTGGKVMLSCLLLNITFQIVFVRSIYLTLRLYCYKWLSSLVTLMLALSPMVLSRAKYINMDFALMAFGMSAIFYYLKSNHFSRKRETILYFSCLILLLTLRPLIASATFLPALFVELIYCYRYMNRTVILRLWAGVILTLLVTLLWYYPSKDNLLMWLSLGTIGEGSQWGDRVGMNPLVFIIDTYYRIGFVTLISLVVICSYGIIKQEKGDFRFWVKNNSYLLLQMLLWSLTVIVAGAIGNSGDFRYYVLSVIIAHIVLTVIISKCFKRVNWIIATALVMIVLSSLIHLVSNLYSLNFPNMYTFLSGKRSLRLTDEYNEQPFRVDVVRHFDGIIGNVLQNIEREEVNVLIIRVDDEGYGKYVLDAKGLEIRHNENRYDSRVRYFDDHAEVLNWKALTMQQINYVIVSNLGEGKLVDFKSSFSPGKVEFAKQILKAMANSKLDLLGLKYMCKFPPYYINNEKITLKMFKVLPLEKI